MIDYYHEHPEELQGQPKLAVAEYVEQNGILVPRRFASYEQALKSGAPLIVRGEHQQDYDGASNIIPTYDFTNNYFSEKIEGITDYDELKEKILEDEDTVKTWRYCRFLGLDKDKLKDEISFSFWEKISGANRAVVADSAVKGRYHVMTHRGEKPFVTNYSVFEHGKPTKSFFSALPQELQDGLAGLVDLYEKIRNLGRFDANHCPMMEFQTDENGNNYFLQYHRTRDFKQSTFTLDREPEQDEIEAFFARGATSPEGADYKVTMIYGGIVHRYDRDEYKLELLEKEDGSFDSHYFKVFTELMLRRRKIQILTEENLGFLLAKIVVEHEPRSQMFKPEISLVMHDNIIRDEEYKPKYEIARETGQDQHMNLHVVSDGTRAFVRKL